MNPNRNQNKTTPTPDAPILVANNVHFAYRENKPVLRGVDLVAHPGQLHCLLGPNGCGKTTLLRCMMGRRIPQTGTVTAGQHAVQHITPRNLAKTIAYVPQQSPVALAMSALQVVLTGRFAHTGPLALAGESDVETALAALRMTQAEPFAHRPVAELSGGEAQRVMIARALAQQPAALLLDEPTSQLDVRNQLIVYEMLQRVAHEWNLAVLCVSHDINLASRFADQLTLLRAGQVAAAGPASQVIAADTLRDVYDVDIELLETPTGTPLVHALSPRTPRESPA